MRGTASSGKNRKPWSLPTSSPGAIESPGALNQHEKYVVVISDDLRLAEEIPLLSVYVGAGFVAEIKTFHKSFYLSFSKKEIDPPRKMY
ncbi:hypothetical protein TNCV_254261 [Trichonephila clavipes]|nr:hypothetical protein TNCV_254261 [Trichonephila clavipes]